MNPAGELKVTARYAAGCLSELDVHLRRPPIARLFVDQPPNAVLKTVPYLYTLCAEAQRAAAQAALAAAGAAVPATPPDHRELWVEFLHETLWRLLLDWPQAFGLTPAREAFIAWRNARHGEDRLAATRALLDGPFAALVEEVEKCLPPTVDRENQENSLVPVLTPADWLPYWRDQAAIPPAWPYPASIAAACHRRLAETRLAAQALANDLPFPVAAAGGEGFGVGQVWTARGVLTHAVQVEDEHVSRYRVWAPTDRHFADAGALTALLGDPHFSSELAAHQRLEQAILALDPCLPYTLELRHA